MKKSDDVMAEFWMLQVILFEKQKKATNINK
jgi:hypothetical protein